MRPDFEVIVDNDVLIDKKYSFIFPIKSLTLWGISICPELSFLSSEWSGPDSVRTEGTKGDLEDLFWKFWRKLEIDLWPVRTASS